VHRKHATHTRKIRLPSRLQLLIKLRAGADETEQKHLLKNFPPPPNKKGMI
jgi:hypothetical protein